MKVTVNRPVEWDGSDGEVERWDRFFTAPRLEEYFRDR